jgi:hypothetical protein
VFPKIFTTKLIFMKPSSYAVARISFTSWYARNLFADVAFIQESKDASPFANGKTVVWGEEGAAAAVKFNSTTGYGAATQVTDVIRQFDLDEVITQPKIVDWTEEQVIAYLKKPAVMESMTSNSRQEIALRTLYRWAPTITTGADQNIIRTTGTARAAGAIGATGTRNALTYADLLAAKKLLDKRNIPLQGRVILITADMLADMMAISTFINADFVSGRPVETGLVGSVLGCKVYMHPTGVQYNASAVPQLPKVDDTFTPYAGATTDNQACFMWHPEFVVRAVSPATRVAIVPDFPGDAVATTAIAGGSKVYTNERGIVAIVEQ